MEFIEFMEFMELGGLGVEELGSFLLDSALLILNSGTL